MRSILKFRLSEVFFSDSSLFKYGKECTFFQIPSGMEWENNYITFSEYSKVLLSSGIVSPRSFNSSRYS